jgi:hypothetical protein
MKIWKRYRNGALVMICHMVINTIQLFRVDKSERDHYYFFKIHTIDSKKK